MNRLFFAALLLNGLLAVAANAQSAPTSTDVGPVRSSAAYSVVLLRKTEIEADLVSFTDDYTEENPRVVDARFELASLTRDLDRMFGIKPSDVGKLTEATGKLITRKAELETERNKLLRAYKDDHPHVKRVTRKLDIYSKAVKQILGQ